MGRDEFRLLHYAGEVNYNVNGVCVCVWVWVYKVGVIVYFISLKETNWVLPATGDAVGSRHVWNNEINSVFLISATGFLDKNNDLLFRNLKEVTFSSPHTFPLFDPRRSALLSRVFFAFAGDVHV